jgi:hypothetical protein
MLRRCVVVIATLLIVGLSRETRAQDSTGAGQALRDIFIGGAFFEDQTEAIINLFQTQTTTFPLGSSAGGFTWTFDPQLGVATRRSQSFGPLFAERPLTNGRGKVNVSLVYQYTDWKELAGQDLNSGGLSYEFNDGTFKDVFSSSLELTTARTIVSATFGLHDRVDVGVQVPFGFTDVSGTSRFTTTRVSNGQVIFDDSVSTSGSSSGIGDVIVRGKVGLPTMGSLDLAAGVDLRLPTGDEENLLGTGKVSTKVMAIGQITVDRLAPHFNVGYTFAGSGVTDVDGELVSEPSDEFDYNFGVDIAATPRVTVVGDVIGRWLKSAAIVSPVTDQFGTFYTVAPGRVNLLLGTVGAKVQLGGMWLITGAVAFPLNSNGVKPGLTPVIGFERAF